MNVEQALAQILNERGYLIIATQTNFIVGDVVKGSIKQPIKPTQRKVNMSIDHLIDQPMCVIGVTDRADMDVQLDRLDQLMNWEPVRRLDGAKFYRVTTD